MVRRCQCSTRTVAELHKVTGDSRAESEEMEKPKSASLFVYVVQGLMQRTAEENVFLFVPNLIGAL